MNKRQALKKSNPSVQVSWLYKPRRVSPAATMVVFVFLIYFASLVFNLSPLTPLSEALRDLSQTPFSQKAHNRLARLYLETNQIEKSKSEFMLAISSPVFNIAPINISPDYSASSVFGANTLGDTQETDLLQNKHAQIAKQQEENREYWVSLTSLHPTYKDAWINLLYAAYNEGNHTETMRLKKILEELEPNSLRNLPNEFQRI